MLMTGLGRREVIYHEYTREGMDVVSYLCSKPLLNALNTQFSIQCPVTVIQEAND
jgi:hypothetical protein